MFASTVRGAALLLAAWVGLSSPTHAQETTGRLEGRVVDVGQNGLDGVRVLVEGPALPVARSAISVRSGVFRLTGLPVGRYRVRVERLGFRTVILTDVEVRLGRNSSLGRIELVISAVELDPLVVRANQTLIDPTSTDVGTALPRRSFERLPTERDYKSIVTLLSQANESFLGDPVNIAGSTGLENMYYVEGVNVTDLYRGRTGTDLPYNFIDAIEIKQAGYQAEHGQALGGLVNVVTRSGTSEFEWGAVGYYTGSAVSADAHPISGVVARKSFSDFDLGLHASGPLVDRRLTFFTAYNPSFRREDFRLPGLGVEQATVTKHMFAGKLRWTVSARTELALSVFGDPTDERRVSPAPGVTLVNADPILTSAREGGTNFTLRWATQVSDRLRLEGSVGRHMRSEDAEGATELGRTQPSFIDRTDLPTIRLSGGNGTDQDISSARTMAKFTAGLQAGRHDLKAGLEFQLNSLDVRNEEAPGQIARLGEALYRSSIFVQDFNATNRIWNLFIQDGWQVSDRIRLNAGVRWDAQFLIDQNGNVGQSITDQLQPRLGLVIRTGEEGGGKIFGHVGRYYQQLALFWSTIGLAGFDQRQVFSSSDPREAPGQVDSTLVISDPEDIRGGTDGLRGEHHDEFVLGFEQQIGSSVVLAARGIHRALKESITAAFRPDREFAGGNPGRGELEHLPRSERKYWALDLSLRSESTRWSALASYVASRNRGNYPGLFVAEAGGLRGGSFGPNNNQLMYFPAQSVNSFGPLPNDRPHVFKAALAHAFTPELEVGTFFTAQSGSPLSELGRVTSGFNAPLFITPRGSEGRTPAIWDLSFRIRYAVTPIGGRVVLDLLHLGNPQTVVNVDQRRFNGARGSPFDSYENLVANQRGERPGFGVPVGFQPPFQIRIGFSVVR
jgi:hypothetical protein